MNSTGKTFFHQRLALSGASFLFVCIFIPNLASAQFAGMDDFSSSTRNTNKWGSGIAVGASMLLQTNQQLYLITTNAPGEDDFHAWPWRTNASLQQSWSVQADVSMPFIALPAGNTAVGIGLAILNSADDADTFGIALEHIRSGGPQMQNFLGALDVNDDGDEISVPAPNSFGSVQISWDVTNRLLRASYDPDGPANGYAWTPLRAFDPTASTNWNMNLSDTCTIVVHGYGEGASVALANNVTLDNFFFQDAARPALKIGLAGPDILVSWPGEAVNYQLEASSAATGGWANAAASVSLIDDRRQVTLGSITNQFFRLKKAD